MKRSRVRRRTFAVIVIATLAGYVVTRWHKPPSANISLPHGSTSQLSGSVAIENIKPADFEYRLERRIEIKALGHPIAYSANLHIRVLKFDENRRLCEAELWNGNEASGKASFTLSPDLVMTDYRAAPTATPPQAAALLDAVSIFAFGSDRDTTGRYRFTRTEEADHHFTKQKTDYVETYRGPTPIILSSVHDAILNQTNSLPIEITGRESWRLGISNSALESQNSYRLVEVPWRAQRTQGPATANQTTTTPPLLNEDSRSELLRLWNEAETLSRTERLVLFDRTLKAMRIEPSLASALFFNASRPGSESSVRNAIGLLATSGSPEAQKILRDFYQSPSTPDKQRKQILTAWTVTDSPLLPETRALLRAEAQTDSASATYALGASLQHGETDTVSEKILTALHERAVTETARINVIEAIGNSGRETFLPALQVELENPSAQVRAKAAFALRFIPGPTADKLIVEFSHDQSPQVRNAAFEAIRYRSATTEWETVFSECAQTEVSPTVRATCSRVARSLASNND